MDVSAMLVARIHFRVLGGVGRKVWLFFEVSCAANIVHVKTYIPDISCFWNKKDRGKELTAVLSTGSCWAKSSMDF